MNFQELNYALSIARYQNLTKAAEELYISQPTLSKCLQKLEREMGGKLFSRSGNTYVPTYLGRRYLEYARKVLALNQDWERELKDMNACMDGELNIAFPLMRSSCMVPSIMKVFHKKYPGVRVNFMEEAHAIQEKLLLNDELDFGIFNETRPHPKLSYETLLREEILLVMPPDHPMAGRGIKRSEMKHLWMDLRLLEKEEFILHFPDQTTGQLALELFEPASGFAWKVWDYVLRRKLILKICALTPLPPVFPWERRASSAPSPLPAEKAPIFPPTPRTLSKLPRNSYKTWFPHCLSLKNSILEGVSPPQWILILAF